MNIIKYLFSPRYRKSWKAGKLIRAYFEDYGRVQRVINYDHEKGLTSYVQEK